MSAPHSCWPEAGQELLLLAACCDAPAALEAWSKWKAHHDIETLDSGSNRLLPLLGHNLLRLGVDEPLMGQLKGIARYHWTQNVLLLNAVAPVLQEFQAAKIEPLVLKGLSLALCNYPKLGLRPMNDCDVMVRSSQIDAAEQLLRRMGWTSRAGSRLMPSLAFKNGCGQEIDLHHYAFPQCPFDRDDGELWSRSIPLRVGSATVASLGATDHLLYVCVRGARWEPAIPVRWVADALALLRSIHAIDWPLLVDTARRRQIVLPLREALEYLHRVFGAPVPDAVLNELRALRVGRLERRERLSVTRPPVLSDGLWMEWTRYRRLRRNGVAEQQIGPIAFFQAIRGVERRRYLPAYLAGRIGVKMAQKLGRRRQF